MNDAGGSASILSSSVSFSSVSIDSRNVSAGCLFVPLVGEFQDGHAYIPEALEKGASCVFINKSEYSGKEAFYTALFAKFPHATFTVVENTLYALQNAAAEHAAYFPNLVKVGITGSSGKTTTKEIIVSILSQAYNVIANEGNLNTETGLPLSVFRIRSEHEVGIFEMGTNRKGEIAELATVLRPQYGIITNIGDAHIGLLGGTRDAIAEEKKAIFSRFSDNCAAIIPEDDSFSDFLRRGINGTVLLYGNPAAVGASNVRSEGIDGTSFDYEGVRVRFPLAGKHNFRNLLAALTLARRLNVPADKIRAGIETVKAPLWRSNIVKGDVTLIQDCYNANPASMASVLDFCAELPNRKIFVLGDMRELGAETDAAHRRTVLHALKAGASYLVLVGNAMCAAYRALLAEDALGEGGAIGEDCKIDLYDGETVDGTIDGSTIDAIAQNVRRFAVRGDIVLLKASHAIGLERLIPLLEPLAGGARDA